MENQDNQQRQDLPLDDSWLDEILNESVAEPTTAKPTDSSSEDIEKLIAETMSQIMEEETQESPYTADEPIVATEEPLADEFVEAIETDIDEFISETRNQIQTRSAEPQEVPLDATQVIEQPSFKDEEYRDVFGDGEVRAKIDFLVHGRDAAFLRLFRRLRRSAGCRKGCWRCCAQGGSAY